MNTMTIDAGDRKGRVYGTVIDDHNGETVIDDHNGEFDVNNTETMHAWHTDTNVA